jgi:CubicO group peptidase (beta-lactamase class C family)
MFAAITISAPAMADTSGISAHIQHIQSEILDPVLIKGAHLKPVPLAERMKSLHVPGVSIAFIHDGKIGWAKGYGVAKIGGPPVTPDTLFQAASISKPVTALAVLSLIQTGKLSLDADVNTYLKSWKVPENAFTSNKPVTVRELLTHTAGMTVHGFPGYAAGQPIPNLLQILNGEAPANTPAIRVDAVPGSAWRYSGGGYVVLQQLLEDVSGEAFPALMRDKVLTPIEMIHSDYAQPLTKEKRVLAATPYDQDGKPVPGGAHTYPEMAPAGLWTTPSDLARYAIEVQNSLSGVSNLVLSKQMAIEMLKPGGLEGWGLGPEVGGGIEAPYFEHGGANDGFMSLLVSYDHGDGAVVMTNGDNGTLLASEIVRTIAHEYNWPDLQPKERSIVTLKPNQLNAFVGYYRVSPESVLVIQRNGDHLVGRTSRQLPHPLYPEGARDFFFTNMDATVEFSVDGQGRTTGLTSYTYGVKHVANRIPADDPLAIWAEKSFRRMDNQKEEPGTRDILKRFISQLRNGDADDQTMTPVLAGLVKDNLAADQRALSKIGETKSIRFHGVNDNGWDTYEVAFEKGKTIWRILLAPDGKIENIFFDGQ